MCSHATRAIVVKKSKVPLDLVTFGNVDSDPGLGCYQMVPGEYAFYVKHPTLIESIDRSAAHKLQLPYMMSSGYDEDKVIVPTLQSIRSGNIHYTFRFQHHQEDPTHYLGWKEDKFDRDYPYSHPVLKPTRRLNRDTELTFDYNL